MSALVGSLPRLAGMHTRDCWLPSVSIPGRGSVSPRPRHLAGRSRASSAWLYVGFTGHEMEMKHTCANLPADCQGICCSEHGVWLISIPVGARPGCFFRWGVLCVERSRQRREARASGNRAVTSRRRRCRAGRAGRARNLFRAQRAAPAPAARGRCVGAAHQAGGRNSLVPRARNGARPTRIRAQRELYVAQSWSRQLLS